MISSSVKRFLVVFVLLLSICVVATGCKKEPAKQAWVNTDSMPGKTFSSGAHGPSRNANSTVVYLGGQSSSEGSNFGPQDVSFEFRDLR